MDSCIDYTECYKQFLKLLINFFEENSFKIYYYFELEINITVHLYLRIAETKPEFKYYLFFDHYNNILNPDNERFNINFRYIKIDPKCFTQSMFTKLIHFIINHETIKPIFSSHKLLTVGISQSYQNIPKSANFWRLYFCDFEHIFDLYNFENSCYIYDSDVVKYANTFVNC